METTTTPIADKIISGLRKAAVELEEFRVQAALGKAEAHDAYESAKKALNKYVHEVKGRFENAKLAADQKSVELKTMFETLQVQLALGKADTKELFEAQVKKINKILGDIEVLIRKNKTAELYYAELQMEIEKFRIKLDILKLQFELRKIDVKEEFEARKREFSKALSDIKDNLLKRETKAENTWENFKDEITDAYSHLKKVFVK